MIQQYQTKQQINYQYRKNLGFTNDECKCYNCKKMNR